MKRAFTIIELIFVIIVLGILASVALPFFQKNYKQSLISKAQSKVTAIRSAIQVYKNKHILLGQAPFPTSLDSDNNHLFDQVLPNAVTPGSNPGEWQKVNRKRYKFLLPDGYIVFDYNNNTGSFNCNDNLSSTAELCNQF